MITGKQAQKLKDNAHLVIRCETYEYMLRKVSKRLQRAIKNSETRALQVSYDISSRWEYDILTDIVEDYKEVGYDVKLVKFKNESQSTQTYAIRFAF